MRFRFSPEQLEIRDAVRSALQAECTPELLRSVTENDGAGGSDHLWSLLAELGVLGINAPEELGGLGLGAVDWVLLLDEAGGVGLPEPLVETVASIPHLAQDGRDSLVKRIVSGQERPPAPDRAHPAVFDRAALAVSARLLGLGRRILDMAVGYAKERRQFGKAIGSFQAVQNHLVDARLALDFAAPAVHRAAWSLDAEDPARSVHVSMAKIRAGEAAALACRKSLQVHGAIGYTHELDLHLYMKQVWAHLPEWGDAAFHRDRVAAAALTDSTFASADKSTEHQAGNRHA